MEKYINIIIPRFRIELGALFKNPKRFLTGITRFYLNLYTITVWNCFQIDRKAFYHTFLLIKIVCFK